IAKSFLSMPSFTLNPLGVLWWFITLYSVGSVSFFGTSPHGFTIKFEHGGFSSVKGPAYLPIFTSLSIALSKAFTSCFIDSRFFCMIFLRVPLYPYRKPFRRPDRIYSTYSRL